MWFTDAEACLYAGVSTWRFYAWLKKNEEFKEWKEVWKEQPKMHAKLAIAKALEPKKMKNKEMRYWSLDTSKRYLEHKANNEFSKRQINDNKWLMKHEMTKEVKLDPALEKKMDALLSKVKAWRSKKRSTKTGTKSKKS